MQLFSLIRLPAAGNFVRNSQKDGWPSGIAREVIIVNSIFLDRVLFEIGFKEAYSELWKEIHDAFEEK